MNIDIKGTHMELTEAIRDYVENKLGSISKIISGDSDPYMRVEVGKDSDHHNKGDVFKAEAELKVAGMTHYAVVKKDSSEY